MGRRAGSTVLLLMLALAGFDTAATAESQQTLDLDCGGDVKMRLVLIPAGEFMMGGEESPEEISRKCVGGPRMGGNLDKDPRAFRNEQPVHRVKINVPFYMGIYCVTQAQYRTIMGANPSRFVGWATKPVEKVSWNDAMQFCKRLSSSTGKTVRLPTEAEWEYACRAGTTTAFNTGETISTGQANYNGTGAYDTGKFGENRLSTTPVGKFPPNAWGLYDMHGNIWEWCHSLYKPYPYDPRDGREDETASGDRVIRGGSWCHAPSNARSAKRIGEPPEARLHDIGFRVVVSADASIVASVAKPAFPTGPLPPHVAEQVRAILMAQLKAFLPLFEEGTVALYRLDKDAVLTAKVAGQTYSAKVFRLFSVQPINANEYDAKEYYLRTTAPWKLKADLVLPADIYLSGIIERVSVYDADTISMQGAAITRSEMLCKVALDQMEPSRKARAATIAEAHKADMDSLTKQIAQLNADGDQKLKARNEVALQLARNPPIAPVTTRDVYNNILWQWSPGQGLTFNDGLDQTRQALEKAIAAQKTLQATMDAELTSALGQPGAKEKPLQAIFQGHRRRIVAGEMISEEEMRTDYESVLAEPLKVP